MTEARPRFTEVDDIDGVAVVRFHDLNGLIFAWEMDKMESLERELLSVVEQNRVAVILDFEGEFFIPAATIDNVLVKLHKKLDARLKMCNLSELATAHFEMNRLDTLFHIYTTLESALDAAKDIDPET